MHAIPIGSKAPAGIKTGSATSDHVKDGRPANAAYDLGDHVGHELCCWESFTYKQPDRNRWIQMAS